MEFSQIPSAVAPATPVTPEAPKKVEEVKVATPEVKEAEAVKAEPVDEGEEYEIGGKKVRLTKAQQKEFIQKSGYADQQMKEAAQLKKYVANLVEKLKSPDGLEEILSDPAIGMDTKKWAIEKVKKLMADEAMDPKDRELESSRKQLAAYKKAEEEAKAQAEQTRKASEVKAVADQLRNDIVQAMDSTPGLPKSQASMNRVIDYMRAAYKKTGKVLPAAEAAQLVVADWKREMNSLLKGRKPEDLQDLFEDDNLSLIEQIKLSKLKKSSEKTMKGDDKKAPMEMKRDRKGRITEKELEKNWRDIVGGL